MYGGVSLAVYINGVSQEFYHAVQGNGIYRLIKELTDSEIVLDIMSGSSAGGINGILLSYALCNGKDFTRCGDLWRNAADIRRLVRAPSNGPEPVRSVLDSEGYYQTELERAFRLMDASPATGERPRRQGTRSVCDGHGCRRSYLQTRPQRRRSRDLGKGLSCCLPPQALVVAESRTWTLQESGSNHRTLQTWRGSRPVFPARSPVLLFSLNIAGKSSMQWAAQMNCCSIGANWPGSHFPDRRGVIETNCSHTQSGEFFFRTTERKVDRKLYYVEPDPERFAERDGNFIPGTPDF